MPVGIHVDISKSVYWLDTQTVKDWWVYKFSEWSSIYERNTKNYRQTQKWIICFSPMLFKVFSDKKTIISSLNIDNQITILMMSHIWSQ